MEGAEIHGEGQASDMGDGHSLQMAAHPPESGSVGVEVTRCLSVFPDICLTRRAAWELGTHPQLMVCLTTDCEMRKFES